MRSKVRRTLAAAGAAFVLAAPTAPAMPADAVHSGRQVHVATASVGAAATRPAMPSTSNGPSSRPSPDGFDWTSAGLGAAVAAALAAATAALSRHRTARAVR